MAELDANFLRIKVLFWRAKERKATNPIDRAIAVARRESFEEVLQMHGEALPPEITVKVSGAC